MWPIHAAFANGYSSKFGNHWRSIFGGRITLSQITKSWVHIAPWVHAHVAPRFSAALGTVLARHHGDVSNVLLQPSVAARSRRWTPQKGKAEKCSFQTNNELLIAKKSLNIIEHQLLWEGQTRFLCFIFLCSVQSLWSEVDDVGWCDVNPLR